VSLGRSWRDPEPLPHFFVRAAGRDQGDHLSLALGDRQVPADRWVYHHSRRLRATGGREHSPEDVFADVKGLEAAGSAVAPAVGSADERLTFDEDALPDPEPVLVGGECRVVAELTQHALLRCQALLQRDAPSLVDAETGRVERALGVETAVDERVDELKMPLRLHRAAHDPERPPQLTVAQK